MRRQLSQPAARMRVEGQHTAGKIMRVHLTTDVWRLDDVDPPSMPVKGMAFWVQTGTHWAIGTNYRIGTVNDRSFFVQADGKRTRFDLADWTRWLLDRCSEGIVKLEGHPMRSPPLAPLFQGGTGVPDPGGEDKDEGGGAMELQQRDARILRAVKDVLKGYTIHPSAGPSPGPLAWSVKRPGTEAYTVTVDSDWRTPPQCTCPDHQRLRASDPGALCKHIIAVLLKTDDHRHQLLDFLL